ncbi:uncharacterized protein C12orf56-like [Actinia tenebrosa]|uniref:Uncharacterized protein C12orf56-like n=1 Tax=Actinia tenebrosa TaxID=6105 RepID=A0A6P8IZ35_ACTTE|nr:uncharacterized protein C12orf56-like [Actinia tenebrosa]
MDDCQQKYQKVYNYLKRTLPQERYEGIRVIDRCVIVADGFNKSFMFAVLGDNMLYITENPPKLPRDIRITVDLSTITNVELIHDIPEFIGGDLRTQTQHIIVTYKTTGPQKTQTKTTKDLPSPRQALQTPLLTASALLRLNLEDEQDSTTVPSASHYHYNKDRIIAEEGSYMKKISRNSNKMSVSEGSIPQLIEQERFQASSSTERHNSLCVPSSGRRLPLPPSHKGHRLDSYSKIKQQPRKSRQKHDSESKELNSSSSSNELDLSQVKTDYSDDRPGRPSSLDLPQTSTIKASWRSSRTRSVDETHQTVEEESTYVTEGSADNISQIHMYILEQGSPMFAFLKSTWNNCILKSTLHFEGQGFPVACSSPRSFSKVDNSQLLTLFNQLKTEILQSHRMEKTFVLINELLTGAQKSFSLKKFFWKSSELFQFIVVQVKLYLPNSPSIPSRRKGNNRSDEFDFVVVLLECLICMFRETEILPSRLNVLKTNKGQSLVDLLESIMATPTLSRPKSEPPKISPAAQLLLMGTSQDSVLSRREDEFSKAIIFPVEGNALNICWLVSLMDSNSSTETFVERMMERQLNIISTRRKHLSPKHAVLLYQQLYILQNIMDYSENMAASIPRSYAEEFRYYIKKPIIHKKLSSRYPLTPPILKLLDKVTLRVLKGKSRTSYR